MDYNERLKKREEVGSEILIDIHHIASDTKEIKENQQRIIKRFDNFGNAVLEKMDAYVQGMKGLWEDLQEYENLEERIIKI